MESSSPFVEHHECSNVACGHFSKINDPQVMSKRLIQERKQREDEPVAAKSKPARYRVSQTFHRSPTALSSSSFQSLVNLTANCPTLDSSSTVKPLAMDSNRDTASGLKCGNQVCLRTPARGYLLQNRQRTPSEQDCSSTTWTCHEYSEKAYSYVQRKLCRPPNDEME